MRAESPQREVDFSAPASVSASRAPAEQLAAPSLDVVPGAPMFAPLAALAATSRGAETIAADLRPADFGPMLTLGAAASTPDVVSIALAVALHASACLGLLQFTAGGARVETGYDEDPIEIVMDTGAGASVVEAERPPVAPAEQADDAAQHKATEPPLQTAVRSLALPVDERPVEAPVQAPADAPSVQREIVAPQPDAEPAPTPPVRAQTDDVARQRRIAQEKARLLEERRERQEEARLAAERARLKAARDAQERERRRTATAALETGRGDAQAAQPRGAAAPRMASLRASESAGGGFDAASYRAIIARAVRAAVGSRCSFGAGSRVVIALTIGGSGAISGVGIASSSGNAAFDSASLSAVRGAGPFPPPAGRSSVSVPVGVSCR